MKVLSPFNFAFVEMPSRLIDRAVDQIAGLPGVGRRTALRLALHLLGRNEEDVRRFTEAIQDMKECGYDTVDIVLNIGEMFPRDIGERVLAEARRKGVL